MKRLFLAVLTAALPTLARAQTVKVDFDKDADFSRFKTYTWSPSQEPVPNAANHLRITRGVESELEARGIVKAEKAPADLTVRYVAKIEKKIRGSSYSTEAIWQPSDLRTMVDFKRVQEGTLIVELYDGDTKLLVWRSVATDTPASPDMIGQQIQDLVKKSFADFPPRPKSD